MNRIHSCFSFDMIVAHTFQLLFLLESKDNCRSDQCSWVICSHTLTFLTPSMSPLKLIFKNAKDLMSETFNSQIVNVVALENRYMEFPYLHNFFMLLLDCSFFNLLQQQ